MANRLEKWVNKVHVGDALTLLKKMPSEFVSLFMFSPPYWSLRDYKVKGQIGLEKDFNEWLVKMWLVMDEIWRVGRKDGTVWVNLGDGYWSAKGSCLNPGGGVDSLETKRKDEGIYPLHRGNRLDYPQLQPKTLLMLPERFALGCLERGWILRNKCIWQKPNPMPCSAKDRFTTTWEYLYFFVKSKKYWFDLDAVRRPHKLSTVERCQYLTNDFGGQPDSPQSLLGKGKQGGSKMTMVELNPAGANPGDVITTKIQEEDAESMGSPRARQWRRREKESVEFFNPRGSGGNPDAPFNSHPAGANPGDFMVIPTQPSALPHYASYPEKLCETPLKAGCPRWICKQCGKARVRVTRAAFKGDSNRDCLKPGKDNFKAPPQEGWEYTAHTLGWTFCSCLCPACGEADCSCGKKWRPGIVLDPFVGTGTTCKVAKRLGLDWIGIDIKKEYCEIAEKEIKKVTYQENMFT